KRALTFDLDRGNGGLDAPEIEQVVDRWRIALPLFPCRVHANRSGTRAIDPEPHRDRVVVDAPSQLEDRHDAPYRGEKARVRVERARGDGPAVGVEDLHVAEARIDTRRMDLGTEFHLPRRPLARKDQRPTIGVTGGRLGERAPYQEHRDQEEANFH